jgi:hypothetical protein
MNKIKALKTTCRLVHRDLTSLSVQRSMRWTRHLMAREKHKCLQIRKVFNLTKIGLSNLI